MMECKRCGNNDRVIKYGIKAGIHLSQMWFCYNCRHLFNTPLDSFSVDNNGNNNDTTTTARREKTERQLLKLAGRSAFVAAIF